MKKLTSNCKGKPCSCDNPVANSSRYETFEGSKYIVVPVVMAIEDVVMNEALLPADEYFSPSWNGVPVTIGHPQEGDSDFISANAPDVHAEWVVGAIFNSKVEDGKLLGEAWVKVDKANKIRPGLVSQLEGEKPMDVSTGFFSDYEETSGTLNGREYKFIHRNVRPDHLALLPDEIGACSWEDGCGVRSNKRGEALKKKVLNIFGVRKNNEDQPKDERGPLVDKLIQSEATPFSDDDRKGLEGMTIDSLKSMCDGLEGNEEEEKPEADPDSSPDDIKEEKETMNAQKIKEIVANAVKEALAAQPSALTADDKAALAASKKIIANKRNDLTAKITANSKITKEFCDKQSIDDLQSIADGLVPVQANFSGRAIPSVNTNDDDVAKAMTPTGIVAAFASKKKE